MYQMHVQQFFFIESLETNKSKKQNSYINKFIAKGWDTF